MDYKKELFAQCTPYLQWLKDREIANTADIKDTGKPICVFPFSSCKDSVKAVLGKSCAERIERETIYLFVREDGVLCDEACALIARAFSEHREALVVYADEDYYGTPKELYSIEEKTTYGLLRGEPWFKPEFSPDTLESFFYIGSIFALKGQVITEVLDASGGDMPLCELVRTLSRRVAAMRDGTHGEDQFVHIPETLYTNNKLSGKDELDCFEQDIFEKTDAVRIGGTRANLGRLSVIIPSKDNLQTLKRCIETFRQCAKDMDYELIIVDNGSTNDNRMRINAFLEACGAKYLYEKAEFNFSQMCNRGAKAAEGDFLLFLNDDIEVDETQSDGRWLEKMMRYAAMEHVGAVGIKLRYPDGNLIQHAGITNMAVGPAHKLCGMPDEGNLYHGHNLADYNMLAVTAACMMVSRKKFERAGGFDEELAVAYNDVELCFRLYQIGLYNVVVNSAFLVHHESLSRGEDTTPEKQARLLREKRKLYDKHPWASPKVRMPDPFYSPNLVQWEKDAAYHINYRYPCDKPTRLRTITKNAKEYRPFLMWFVRTTVRSNLERMHIRLAKLYNKLTGEDRHLFHIDKIAQEDGMVTITGWHVLRKRNNAKLVKKLWIYTPHLNFYEAELFPKLRRDVEALFAEEHRTVNTALSGICLKFEAAQLPKGMYGVGIVVKGRTGRQFVILDRFEL